MELKEEVVKLRADLQAAQWLNRSLGRIIEGLSKELKAQQEWQPIETAPEEIEDVVMLWVDGEAWYGHRVFDYWKVFGYPKNKRPNPTLWMPLPQPPKGEG